MPFLEARFPNIPNLIFQIAQKQPDMIAGIPIFYNLHELTLSVENGNLRAILLRSPQVVQSPARRFSRFHGIRSS